MALATGSRMELGVKACLHTLYRNQSMERKSSEDDPGSDSGPDDW